MLDQTVLESWMESEVRPRISFRAAILGFGAVAYAGFPIDLVLRMSVPESYVLGLTDDQGNLRSAALTCCLECRQAVIFEPPRREAIDDLKWRDNFRRHGFRNCLIDAVIDPQVGRYCFVTLFDLTRDLAEAREEMRQACTLSALRRWQEALSRSESRSRVDTVLTAAERQLVELVLIGKTNWEIAHILQKSEATVRSQLHAIYGKTGVANRTQLAVRLARKT